MEIVAVQGHALPLGQRVHDLRALTADGGNVERHRALHAVEIVVQAAGRLNKQRGSDALEMQRKAQLLLKQVLDQADGLLRVVQPETGAVPFRNPNMVHVDHSLAPARAGAELCGIPLFAGNQLINCKITFLLYRMKASPVKRDQLSQPRFCAISRYCCQVIST